MQDDISEQAVMVLLRGTEVTAAGLKKHIKAMLENRQAVEHGEQSLKKLNLQNKQLDSVALSREDVRLFRRQLNRYRVDFAILKDKESGLRTVYFKSQDVDRVYDGLEKCIKGLELDKESKKPIKEVIASALERAAQRAQQQKQPDKEHATDRGRDI